MKKRHLILEDISFTFKKDDPYFFHHLNGCFESGSLNFILGSNGVGKSTLFRIILGELYSAEQVTGHIICGAKKYSIELQRARNQMASCVGLVEQNIGIMVVDQFTCVENMQMAALGHYPALLPMQTVEMPDFIVQFGIDYQKPVGLLSGGQRQIVAIAMMLQKSKKVLLLDEPTAALDEHNAQLVFQFLREITMKTSIIILIISHDSALVSNYSSGVYYVLKQKHDGSRALVMQ